MKKLEFYKVYAWMIDEFGFSPECGIYALIWSFHENGKQCEVSTQTLADFAKCGRRTAQRIITELESDGYIIITRRTSEGTKGKITSLYSPNIEKANAIMTLCQNGTTLCQNDTTPCAKMAQPLRQNDTTPCAKMAHKEENNNIEDIREEEKRVCAAGEIETDRPTETETEHTPAYHDFGGMYPHVRITEEQYARLKQYAGMKDGRDLDYYFRLMESQIVNGGKKYKDHALKISLWCEQDGGKVIDSSIDMSAYDAMMNGGKIPRRYYTPSGGLGDDKIIG